MGFRVRNFLAASMGLRFLTLNVGVVGNTFPAFYVAFACSFLTTNMGLSVLTLRVVLRVRNFLTTSMGFRFLTLSVGLVVKIRSDH